MAFDGHLLYIMNGTTAVPFPNEFIQFDTWKSTPNVRVEVKAYRDDYSQSLTRFTATGLKSHFAFTTKPNLHLADKTRLINYFYNYETSHLERKVTLKYWNDEDNSYHTGSFYRPDMEFPIKKIIDKAGSCDIIYGELTLEFVEY